MGIADRTSSDPYAVVSYGGNQQQTKRIAQNLNPIWNDVVRFPNGDITDLEINVFDYDVRSSDDFLGGIVIKAEDLQAMAGRRVTHNLTGRGAQGTIEIECQ